MDSSLLLGTAESLGSRSSLGFLSPTKSSYSPHSSALWGGRPAPWTAGGPQQLSGKGTAPGPSVELSHRRVIESNAINPSAVRFRVRSGQAAVPGETSTLPQRETALTVT